MNLSETIAVSGYNATLDELLEYPVELMSEQECTDHLDFWNDFLIELKTALASTPEAKQRSRDYYRRNKRRILAKKKKLRQNKAHQKKSEIMSKSGKTPDGKEKQLKRGNKGGHSNLKTESDKKFLDECFKRYSKNYKPEPVRSHENFYEYVKPERERATLL